MSPPSSERMSRVDHAWLRMDSDANLMMIIGFWLLAPKLTLAELTERIQTALLAYPRFRQKVVEDDGGAAWVEDEHFDLSHHVTREALRSKPGEAPLEALKRRVAALATQPLDPSRPLWQFHLIEDLDGTQSAMICRIHHCIGDGIALISVTLSIADGGKPPPQRKARESAHDGFAETLIKPLIDLTSKGMDVGLHVIQDAAALLLMADDSHTRLKGKATPGKRVAWSRIV